MLIKDQFWELLQTGKEGKSMKQLYLNRKKQPFDVKKAMFEHGSHREIKPKMEWTQGVGVEDRDQNVFSGSSGSVELWNMES